MPCKDLLIILFYYPRYLQVCAKRVIKIKSVHSLEEGKVVGVWGIRDGFLDLKKGP